MASSVYGLGAVFRWSASGANAALATTGRRVQTLEQRLHRVGRAAKGFHDAMGRVALLGTGAAFGFAVGLRQASKFEHQMSAVGAVTRATTAQLVHLRQSAIDVGMKGGFLPLEVAKAMEELGKADFNAAGTLQALPGVMSLARAEGVSLAKSTTLVSEALKSFQRKNEESGHVADVLSIAANRSTASVEDFGQALKYAAPNAILARKSFEEVTAALTVLASAGIKGSLGGTVVKNLMTRLGTLTKSRLKEIGGQRVVDSIIKEKDGSLKTLDQIAIGFMKRAQELFPKDSIKQTGFLSSVFGLRGVPGIPVMQLKNAEGEGFAELHDMMGGKNADGTWKSSGFAAENARRRMDNLTGDMIKLRSVASALNIQFMKSFEPTFRRLTQRTFQFGERLFDSARVIGRVDEETGQFVRNSRRTGGLAGVMQGFQRGLETAVERVAGGMKFIMEKFQQMDPRTANSIGRGLSVLTVGGPLMLGLLGIAKLTQIALGPLVSLFGVIRSVGVPGMLALGVLFAAFYSSVKNRQKLTGEDFGVAAMGTAVEWMERLKATWDAFSDGFSYSLEENRGRFDGWLVAFENVGSGINKAADIFLARKTDFNAPPATGWWALGNAIGNLVEILGKLAEISTQGWSNITGWAGHALTSGDRKRVELSKTEALWETYGRMQDMNEGIRKEAAGSGSYNLAQNFMKAPQSFRTTHGVLGPEMMEHLKKQVEEGNVSNLDGTPVNNVRSMIIPGVYEQILSELNSPRNGAFKMMKRVSLGQNKITLDDLVRADPGADGKVDYADIVAAAVKRLSGQVGPEKIEVTINAPVNVDGRKVGQALARHEIDLRDRSGKKTSPRARGEAETYGRAPGE